MSKKEKAKKDIMSLGVEELGTTAKQLEDQIFKFRMQHATGQLANTASIRLARKELARAKTALTMKSKKTETASKQARK